MRMNILWTRGSELVPRATGAWKLSVAMCSVGLAACNGVPPEGAADGAPADDAGLGALDSAAEADAAKDAPDATLPDATPDAAPAPDASTTPDGSVVSSDAASLDAAIADATTSDVVSPDAESADTSTLDAVAADAQTAEGGPAATMCGATCGPDQMSCGSVYDSVVVEALPVGLNYCFPQSDAGCPVLGNPNHGGPPCIAFCDAAVVCPPGVGMCDGACADTTSDPANCGACDNVCGGIAGGYVACIDSVCTPGCPPGFTPCGATCTITTADTANCGACGHACASGEICNASACVAPSSAWLATGLTAPSAINVDSTQVYWSDSTLNSISGVPIAGGSIVTVVPPQATPLTGLPFDDTYIYYWQGPIIMRARKDGTAAPQEVATISAQGIGLGVDSTSVYFTGVVFPQTPPFNVITIQSVPKAGGSPSTYLATTSAGTLAVAVSDSLAMYVLSVGGGNRPGFLQSYDFGGTDAGPNGSTAELGPFGPLFVDATNVYAQSGFAGWVALPKFGGSGGVTVPGVPGNLLAGASCGVLSADSAGLHWTALSSMRVTALGQQPSLAVATQLIAPGVGPVVSIIADADSLYWTDGSGAIGKLRLP
jgi:hypothetical protein